MGKDHLLILGLLLLAIPCQEVRGQDAVELWGGWGTWAGEDAGSFEDGYTLGISYLADVNAPLDIGADLGFPKFGPGNPILPDVVEFQASLMLRRWLLGREAATQPFLGARMGFSRLASDLETPERVYKFEQNGVLMGPSLGLVVPTGKALSPMITVEALYQRYADASAFLDGIELPQSGGAAWRFFVKAGVSFGSGWKRRGG